MRVARHRGRRFSPALTKVALLGAVACGPALAQTSYPPPPAYPGGSQGPQAAPPYQAPQAGGYQQQAQGGYQQDGPGQETPEDWRAMSQPRPEGGPLQPGEAFVTRFSGATINGSAIDVNGPTGVVIGVARPNEPPQGQHWISKPIRTAVTAGQVGQVFGVALDDQQPPNVYLTATAAFGLHLQQGVWMPGQWGLNGGPGTVWRLDPSGRAAPFADLRLNGRANTGAALGNIAFDRMNRQFFVSDLETGMIHRLSRDGRDMGAFDHGTMGRQGFVDAESGQRGSLPPIAFDPSSAAQYQNCQQGPFESTPACWNVAASGRAVWGLGVRRDPMGEGARLYYGVWSSPTFGRGAWQQFSDDEKRNSVWSVRLGPNGDFDPSDIRREFVMPDFFSNPQDIERAGYSQPVSDIAFAECGERPVMLVSERGGLRNLGLAAENAFATPGEARTLRYELDQNGAWRGVGRYDVGNEDRAQTGAPIIRANCAGGAAFGPSSGVQAPGAQADGPAQTVWITGDNLCTPQAPCRLPPQAGAPQQASTGAQPQGDFEADTSHVHGLQGTPAEMIGEIAPEEAGQGQQPSGSQALENSWLIDVDQILDANGGLNEQQLARNDATRTGDVAIYQVCAPPPPPPRPVRAGAPWVNPVYLIPPPPPSFVVPGHGPDRSHARWASHGQRSSHYRFGSHSPEWSHQRWRSHWSYWSHSRLESHNPRWSHNRRGSHNRWLSSGHNDRSSHWQRGSHSNRMSHNPRLSDGHPTERSHYWRSSHNTRRSDHRGARSEHYPAGSNSHQPPGSFGHRLPMSPGHYPIGSHGHNRGGSDGSHQPPGSLGHRLPMSPGHYPIGSHGHNRGGSDGSHQPPGSLGHRLPMSPGHQPPGSFGHRPPASPGHNPAISSGGIHAPAVSKGSTHAFATSSGTPHNPVISRRVTHNPQVSRGQGPHDARASGGLSTHNLALSRGAGTHTPLASRGGTTHTPLASRGGTTHAPLASRGVGGHRPALSRGVGGHRPAISRGVGGHRPAISRGVGGHRPALSRGVGGHRPAISRGVGGHRVSVSRGPRVHPPRFNPPRMQRQRFTPPRIQRQRFNAPRVQRQQFRSRPVMRRNFSRPAGRRFR
jgi:hypothetical protein